MARIFVSHAAGDLAWAQEIHRWLTDLGHEVFLDRDPQAGIVAGDRWEQRLYERLRWADAMVCVMTAAYRASAWCTAEIGIARSRGSRLLPVIAEPGQTHPLLSRAEYQQVDLTVDPRAAQEALVAACRRLDAEGSTGWPDGQSPFPGLRPLDADLRRVFFGRRAEVEELAGHLRAADPADERGVLLVVGQSGCGKSSLVRAGLGPTMVAEPGWWVVPPLVPGTDPLSALAVEVAAAARGVGLAWTVPHVRERLSAPEGLRRLSLELLAAAPGPGRRTRLLVIVDQAEELLTHSPPPARSDLVRALTDAMAGPVRVVATVRPEFLGRLLAEPELASVPARTVNVRPLRREALASVVEEPARLAGIEVDTELVARLVEDTGSGTALPLLAFTLARLAEGVGRGGRLSVTRYEELGGVTGAIARQADAALGDAARETGRSQAQILTSLLTLVSVDEQGSPVRRRVRAEDLPDVVRDELDAFVTRRLVTTDSEGPSAGTVLSVAHEAFLSAWPPLATAIAAAASGLRARRAVEQAAADWDRAARPLALLWERGQLAAAVAALGASFPVRHRRWRPGRRSVVTKAIEVSTTAAEFLRVSMRRDRRRRRRTVTVLSALLAMSVAGAGVAEAQRRVAESRQREATARQLVVQADALRDTDPATALRLGLAAQDIQADAQTRTSLVDTLIGTHFAGTLAELDRQVVSVAFSRTGRVATAGDDGTVIVSEGAGSGHPARPVHRFRAAAWLNTIAISPDGRSVAAGGPGGIVVWDVSGTGPPSRAASPMLGHRDAVVSVAFSPDGRTLATGSADRTALLWDVHNPTHPVRLGAPLRGHTGMVMAVEFSPDGRTLATGGYDGVVRLWDVRAPARPVALPVVMHGHRSPVRTVAFSPDGRILADGSYDGTVLLWDVATPVRPVRAGRALAGHTGAVLATAFAPDGRTLATGGEDGSVRLWDIADSAPAGAQLSATFQGHHGAVWSVAFAPDGRTLASGSADHSAILWSLPDRAQPIGVDLPTPPSIAVRSATFSPDASMLAIGDLNGAVSLWNVADPRRPTPVAAPWKAHRGAGTATASSDKNEVVTATVFSPDGRLLATGSLDRTVILWDVSDETHPRRLGLPLTGHDRGVAALAFSPDGRTLASGSSDRTVRLWDLTDRTRPVALGAPLIGHGDIVFSLAFSPNGRTLASAGDEGTVRLWELGRRGRQSPAVGRLKGLAQGMTSVAFSADGRDLAVASCTGAVARWDVADPAHPRLDRETPDAMVPCAAAVALAPGNAMLAVSDGARMVLRDVADPSRPRRLGRPLIAGSNEATTAVFSADGGALVTAGSGRPTTVWDLRALQSLRLHGARVACDLVGHGLSRAEWGEYVTGLPYRDPCRR